MPAHHLALARHVGIRAVVRDQLPRHPVVTRDELLAPIPNEEAGTMDHGVRETPQRVRVIGQEVWRDHDVVVGANGIPADSADRASGGDSAQGVYR